MKKSSCALWYIGVSQLSRPSKNEISRIFNFFVKYERSEVIRNTSSISHVHTVVTEKNTHDFRLRVGSSVFSSRKQEEEQLHDYYVNYEFIQQHQLNFSSPKHLKNQGTMNCSSGVKVTDNQPSRTSNWDIREPLMLIKLFSDLFWYLTSLSCKETLTFHNHKMMSVQFNTATPNPWAQWYALRKKISFHTIAESPLFDRIICLRNNCFHTKHLLNNCSNSM